MLGCGIERVVASSVVWPRVLDLDVAFNGLAGSWSGFELSVMFAEGVRTSYWQGVPEFKMNVADNDRDVVDHMEYFGKHSAHPHRAQAFSQVYTPTGASYCALAQ
jgi:hypothetical protein